jgi:hypothetical protein
MDDLGDVLLADGTDGAVAGLIGGQGSALLTGDGFGEKATGGQGDGCGFLQVWRTLRLSVEISVYVSGGLELVGGEAVELFGGG